MARLYEFKEEEEKSCRKKFYAKNNSTRKTKVKCARAHTEYLMWHATIWQSGCFAVVCLRFSCAISRDFKQQTTNERMQLVYVRAPAWRVICARRLRDHDIEFVDGVGGMHVANIYMRLSALAMLDCQVQRRRGCDNHLRCRSNRGAAILPKNFELCMFFAERKISNKYMDNYS